jgi:hypothetical protein
MVEKLIFRNPDVGAVARSETFRIGSSATLSMNRTQRVQRMQRLGTYRMSGPKSSTGL